MAVMKTPGVYVVEKNAFPNSVVEVATAVPAFVGYTEKALKGNDSQLNIPTRISSMAEFYSIFGGAPTPVFKVVKKVGDSPDGIALSGYMVEQPSKIFSLYYNLLLFFSNGGGPCYIVSVGDYSKAIDATKILNGINTLLREQEPTMLVIPEAVNLKKDECYQVQQAMLKHCGYDAQNRFAILDVFQAGDDSVKQFREGIGSNQLNYGAAYYPWLKTSVIGDAYVSEANLEYDANLKALLLTEAADWKDKDILKLINRIDTSTEKAPKAEADKNAPVKKVEEGKLSAEEKAYLHSVLSQNSTLYKVTFSIIKKILNLLPPSAAIAGIYTMVDNTRGVWKAPANVSISGVISPTINISNEEQEDLNVCMSGKSVNAIRTFPGNGILVWGARTLDSNNLDWRYVNVRRTIIFLEESIQNAARAYVFDPNTANTWVSVKSMLDNFLLSVWKRGGLAGSSPEDAFKVNVGLGETMTPEDILEGVMRVTVLVAITRPAEFIEITFQQQMQKS